MLVYEFELSGSCTKDFDTEIKFNLATARFDGADLVKIALPVSNAEGDTKRLMTCVSRILGSLKKEGTIQFYLTPMSFEKMSTEVQYVLNKFREFVTSNDKFIYYYIKF